MSGLFPHLPLLICYRPGFGSEQILPWRHLARAQDLALTAKPQTRMAAQATQLMGILRLFGVQGPTFTLIGSKSDSPNERQYRGPSSILENEKITRLISN